RKCYVRVALDVPIPALYDYCSAQVVEVGQRVIVPFGRREMVGMVVERPAAPAIEATQLRAVSQVLDDLPPMPDDWLRLMEFAARYYQRPLGEVIMPALPAPLRRAHAYTGKRAGAGPVRRLEKRLQKATAELAELPASVPPSLTDEQFAAVAEIVRSEE